MLVRTAPMGRPPLRVLCWRGCWRHSLRWARGGLSCLSGDMLSCRGMRALPPREKNRLKSRRARRRLRKWRRFLSRCAGPFAALAVPAALVYVVFFSSLFSLESIEVGISPCENRLEEESLKQELRKRISGSNLLLLRSRRLSFLEDDPAVEGFEIEKRWPDGLAVKVIKRVPRAILEDPAGQLFLVDKAGVVFSRAKDQNLPFIKYLGPRLSLGDRVAGREVNFVLYVLDEASNEGLSIESIRAGADIQLKFIDGPEIILPVGDREAVSRMVEITRDFKQKGESLTRVDLRYKNAVIEY